MSSYFFFFGLDANDMTVMERLQTTVQAAAQEGHKLHMASLKKGVSGALKEHMAGHTTPLVQD
jgi:hypothetical protein